MAVARRDVLITLGAAAAGLLAGCQSAPSAAPTPGPGPTAAPAAASPADSAWQALVQSAQAEKTVVLRGPPTGAVRTNLPKAFKDAFGIEVQYTGGPSSDAVTQFTNERQAGVYSTDVLLAGADSMYGGFYAGKMLDPLLPSLVLPDARDVSKWPNGNLWFMDPEQQYILRLNNYATPLLSVNTQQVRPDAIQSWNDLLKPEYTGKIAGFDPTSSGAGISAATYLATSLGEEYVTRLYRDQQVTRSRDHRQLADWLARGVYPVVLALRDVEFQQVKSDGLPVELLRNPPEAPGFVSAGFGLLALVNHASHPNAAKVLVNWLASKDGMDVWSRAQGIPPVRTDLDMSAYPAEELIEPNRDYLDSFGWDYVVRDRDQQMKRLQQVLGT